jgi:hypothetical protein
MIGRPWIGGEDRLRTGSPHRLSGRLGLLLAPARFALQVDCAGEAPRRIGPCLRVKNESVSPVQQLIESVFGNQNMRSFLKAAITHTGFRRWRRFSDLLPNDFYSELNLPR